MAYPAPAIPLHHFTFAGGRAVACVSGREGGSGLGLSLAQSFVEQHQGMIEIDSRPGRTCFTILLPITDRT